jgi:hypothetical protein
LWSLPKRLAAGCSHLISYSSLGSLLAIPVGTHTHRNALRRSTYHVHCLAGGAAVSGCSPEGKDPGANAGSHRLYRKWRLSNGRDGRRSCNPALHKAPSCPCPWSNGSVLGFSATAFEVRMGWFGYHIALLPLWLLKYCLWRQATPSSSDSTTPACKRVARQSVSRSHLRCNPLQCGCDCWGIAPRHDPWDTCEGWAVARAYQGHRAYCTILPTTNLVTGVGQAPCTAKCMCLFPLSFQGRGSRGARGHQEGDLPACAWTCAPHAAGPQLSGVAWDLMDVAHAHTHIGTYTTRWRLRVREQVAGTVCHIGSVDAACEGRHVPACAQQGYGVTWPLMPMPCQKYVAFHVVSATRLAQLPC